MRVAGTLTLAAAASWSQPRPAPRGREHRPVIPTGCHRRRAGRRRRCGPSNAWAVGYTSTTTLILHFNGHSWQVESRQPGAYARLLSVSASSAHGAWAVGTGHFGTAPLAERMTGSGWKQVPAPNPRGDTTHLRSSRDHRPQRLGRRRQRPVDRDHALERPVLAARTQPQSVVVRQLPAGRGGQVADQCLGGRHDLGPHADRALDGSGLAPDRQPQPGRIAGAERRRRLIGRQRLGGRRHVGHRQDADPALERPSLAAGCPARARAASACCPR